MDLAVVAALLEHHQLLSLASLDLPQMMQAAPVAQYYAPTKVDSMVSFVKPGRHWVASVSGGVQFLPWLVADNTEQVDEVAKVREQVSVGDGRWYW